MTIQSLTREYEEKYQRLLAQQTKAQRAAVAHDPPSARSYTAPPPASAASSASAATASTTATAAACRLEEIVELGALEGISGEEQGWQQFVRHRRRGLRYWYSPASYMLSSDRIEITLSRRTYYTSDRYEKNFNTKIKCREQKISK